MTGVTLVTTLSFIGLIAMSPRTSADEPLAGEMTFSNPSGVHRTLSTGGAIDGDNPFFHDLGTNGRSCFTCHRPAQAWAITPTEVRDRPTVPRASIRSSAATTARIAKAMTSRPLNSGGAPSACC